MSGNPFKQQFFLFCLGGLLAVLPVAAQTRKNAEIKRIDAYVKTLDAFVKNRAPQLIFADTSAYDEDRPPKWQRFASEKALEKFRGEQSETYTVAYNWQQKGSVVKSNFTRFSPSGDWTEYVFHTFRADGSLAFVRSEMRTFNGDLIIIQDFYFDRAGRLLKKSIGYRDLQTQKPIRATRQFLETRANFSNDVEYYKKVSRLPFAGLLKKPRR
ncbi:MAG TPA: hypothetical protein VIL74_03690 [Pyrinomonadaceae bacterium]|jgi:hypothetical protein